MENDLVKLYGGETDRLWRNKAGMDATRNAAVIILFGMIAVAFGFDEPTSHRVPYFGSLAVFALVIFEARLFRFGAACEQRVQLLERNVLPSLFNPSVAPDPDWEARLSASYAHPQLPSFWEALAYRIYKNYFLIFLALDVSWLSKVYLAPQPAESFVEFIHRLDLGFFSGWITMAFMGLFWAGFVVAVIYIRKARKQKGYLHGY